MSDDMTGEVWSVLHVYFSQQKAKGRSILTCHCVVARAQNTELRENHISTLVHHNDFVPGSLHDGSRPVLTTLWVYSQSRSYNYGMVVRAAISLGPLWPLSTSLRTGHRYVRSLGRRRRNSCQHIKVRLNLESPLPTPRHSRK